MTWIIVSICLYFIGMVPGYILADGDEDLSELAKYVIAIFWPPIFLVIFTIIFYDKFIAGRIKSKHA